MVLAAAEAAHHSTDSPVYSLARQIVVLSAETSYMVYFYIIWPNKNILFGLLYGPNRIIEYLVVIHP